MDNINIESFDKLSPPNEVRSELPTNQNIIDFVEETRDEIKDILTGVSPKKLFIVGPCSVHNTDEALQYGSYLKKLAHKVSNHILIVMRVYFEKPRTTVGWKGLINDPDLNGTYDVNKGILMARKLLLDLNNLGIPCGYEALDTITPQYISDLVSWSAIGARTTESQVHREMVSGLSMPVGFKNGTGGSKLLARDAILSAKYPHCFMGITMDGTPSIVKTVGNQYCHTILRGGSKGPNYHCSDINEMVELLKEKDLPIAIMIDCSHGNSKKDYRNQHIVLKSVIQNMTTGGKSICGVMIESNINEGKQSYDYLSDDPKILKFGVSITDSCIGMGETENIILDAYGILKQYKGDLRCL
jgi:3-deoxy-7-phosphoheptulonate synthase